MKTIAIAATLVALIAAAAAPAQAGTGHLPQTFNDQGSQVPAFPGSR